MKINIELFGKHPSIHPSFIYLYMLSNHIQSYGGLPELISAVKAGPVKVEVAPGQVDSLSQIIGTLLVNFY